MDLENLARAAEIKKQLEKLQEASDILEGSEARVWVFPDGSMDPSCGLCFTEKGFMKDLQHLIDEYIDTLLDEAKIL